MSDVRWDQRGWVSGVSVLIALLAWCTAGSVPCWSQDEYYIPRREEPLAGGQWQLGLRWRLGSDEGGARREVELIPSATYSPVQGLELTAELPLVHARQPEVEFADQTSESGIGDLFLQAQGHLAGSERWRLLWNLSTVFPTGRDPIEHEIGLGDGFFRVTPGLTVLTVNDPVLSFLHIGYEIPQDEEYFIDPERTFPQDLRELLRIIFFGFPGPPPGTHTFEPGEALRFRAGTTLLLNPTTRMNLFGSFDLRNETEIDGEPQPGFQSDSILLGGGFDYDLGPRTRLQTNLILGISDPAQDLTFDMGYVYSF